MVNMAERARCNEVIEDVGKVLYDKRDINFVVGD